MLFNSYVFVFLFFPICLTGYYGLSHLQKTTAVKIFLIAMSFWFYGYFNVSYLLIMIGSIGGNYLFHRLLSHSPRREIMITAVAFNLGVLFYFKYYDFFISTINTVFGADAALRHILLPLGISFFTFQQISFVADTYKGEVRDCSLIDYALFVSFFPQLIAGPIVNHTEMLPQFRQIGKGSVLWDRIAEGFGLFILGLSKKVLLADTFGAGVDYGYANIGLLGRAEAVLVILFYALQLYFDFSGYCDMAVGIGKMFGVELPQNFNSPYKSVSVRDFWRRWHITLGRFFTAYVYIPLGGSRKGKLRTMRNTMIVFFLSGLWHGANWTFVVWGLLYGVAMAVNILHPVSEKDGKRHVFGHIVTFLFHYLAFIVFRSDTLADAVRYFKGLFSMTYFHSLQAVAGAVEVPELYIVEKFLSMRAPQYVVTLHMAELFAALAVGMLLITRKNARQMIEGRVLTGRFALGLAVLFAWSVISLSGVSIFLYFNF